MPRRLFAVALIGLAGCSRPQPAPVVALPAPAPPDPAPPAAVESAAEAKQPDPPPPAFAFPADVGGQAVAKVVTPAGPPPLPTDRGGKTPKARSAPPGVTSPEAIGTPSFRPPPVALSRPAGLKLVPPKEGVPLDVGGRAEGGPARPKLPEGATAVPRARDPNRPPDLPILGRPLSDRVSLDDPTADFGREAIVSPRVGVPLTASPFVRATVPDPFELGEQVRPKLPAGLEPAVTPVPVGSQRK